MIAYRDGLVASIMACGRDGERWAKGAGTRAVAAKVKRAVAQTYADSWRRSVKWTREACIAALRELDEKIQSTTPKAVARWIRRPGLQSAVDAARTYLQEDTELEREIAWRRLALTLPSETLKSREQLDKLVTDARQWQRTSGRSGSRKVLARFMVARLVGLSPDARELR